MNDAGMGRRLHKIAAVLMMTSGITHVSQLAVYGLERSAVVAATFGAVYFGIGVALLGTRRAALWFGAALPTVGGVLGVYRFFFVIANPFSVLHVLIDIIVVPICAYLVVSERARAARVDSRAHGPRHGVFAHEPNFGNRGNR